MKLTNLKEMRIVRYADDFRIFCRTKTDAEKAMIAITQWLQELLKLEVSPEKTRVVKVDGNAITMTADNGSNNAKAPLTIVNARGFDLPQTGDTGTWLYSVIGIVLMAGAAAAIVIVSKKKSA